MKSAGYLQQKRLVEQRNAGDAYNLQGHVYLEEIHVSIHEHMRMSKP